MKKFFDGFVDASLFGLQLLIVMASMSVLIVFIVASAVIVWIVAGIVEFVDDVRFGKP